MDDRKMADAVTNLLGKFRRTAKRRDNLVTCGHARLSLSLVWTGLALHG
jgi:hypothetical protein